MFCRKCGTKLADGVGFCPNCGTPQKTASDNQTTATPGSGPQSEATFNTYPSEAVDQPVSSTATNSQPLSPNPNLQGRQVENWQNKEYNIILTKYAPGPYKTTYTDILINGSQVNIDHWSRTFLIKHGKQKHDFNLANVYYMTFKRKLSFVAIYSGIVEILLIIFCLVFNFSIWVILGLLGCIIVDVYCLHTYYLEITYNGGNAIIPYRSGNKSSLEQIRNYFLSHNPSIQIVDKC